MWSGPIIKVIIVTRRVMAHLITGLSYYGHPDSRVTPYVMYEYTYFQWFSLNWSQFGGAELFFFYYSSNIFLGILIEVFSYFHRDSFHM